MPKSRQKLKGRRESGTFAAWPHECAKHASYAALSLPGKALLLELLGQFNGFNNGDLTCAYTVLGPRGWNSRTTVDRACRELESLGWIVRTRQGGKNRCNLFAFTFRGIDRCPGQDSHHKLDVPPNPVPLGFWREGRNPWLAVDGPSRPKGNGLISKPSSRTTLVHDMDKSGKSITKNTDAMSGKWASQAGNGTSPCPADGHLKESTKGGAVDSAVAVGLEVVAGRRAASAAKQVDRTAAHRDEITTALDRAA